jgi:hypothetical protein
MQAYEIQSAFGLDNLKLAQRPDPKPGHKLIVRARFLG